MGISLDRFTTLALAGPALYARSQNTASARLELLRNSQTPAFPTPTTPATRPSHRPSHLTSPHPQSTPRAPPRDRLPPPILRRQAPK